MIETEIAELSAWIAEAGLAGRAETHLVAGFCEKLVACGLPLARATVFVDTLHPVHEGRAFRWDRGQPEATLAEYGRSTDGEAAERWRSSAFFHLVASGESLLRRSLVGSDPCEFPMLDDLRAAGMSDFVAIVNRFGTDGAIGEMDCIYSSWVTDRAGGFGADDIEALRRLMPFLGLAVKSASLGRIAATLVETYLGRDAGRRVLSGRIARGVSDRIDAVLWFSDLRNYTRISDSSPPEQIIPLLNDYADAVVSAIHQEGGDVLKLIGDGVLAIFPAEERARACAAALDAAASAQQSVAALNERRAGQNLPVTDMYLGLHIGAVFYGNIGSKERLDFTIIGPAVNEVSRIAAMCRSADQPVLTSAAFAASALDRRDRLVSVGRFALRGVQRPQELFTLDPGN
jgi:adenylate cyclase